jgi:choline dehydrogenase-like flavoprotein
MNEFYDAIIIGSGAGGSAAAYRLVKAGKRVLLIEKGRELPRDASTLDVERVVRYGTFKSKEHWIDGRGRLIVPEEYFNVGGKTKWYGAHEFDADTDHLCPGWPFDYAELVPYYEEVERLLGVRTFECEPDLARIVAGFQRSGAGWQALPLPMGLASNIREHPEEAMHFDGFASAKGLKADAEVALLEHIRDAANLRLLTGQPVTALLPAEENPERVEGVRLADGQTFCAPYVLLAAGALHSPRLLQRYLAATGLARSLPSSQQVGRNLKLHLLTAVIAISASRKHDQVRKTTALLSERLSHSSVQPLGFDAELIAELMPAFVPRWFARQLSARAYGFFLQTEDASHPDNRVEDSLDGDPRMDYDAARSVAGLTEHCRLVRALRGQLLAQGYLSFSRRIGIEGTAHACGTLISGGDPARSVVDGEGRVHGLTGLYVVDGSVLPRSSRVNPSLTIYAWALRVADRLLARTSDGTETGAVGGVESVHALA